MRVCATRGAPMTRLRSLVLRKKWLSSPPALRSLPPRASATGSRRTRPLWPRSARPARCPRGLARRRCGGHRLVGKLPGPRRRRRGGPPRPPGQSLEGATGVHRLGGDAFAAAAVRGAGVAGRPAAQRVRSVPRFGPAAARRHRLRAADAGVVHACGELRDILLRRQAATAALRRLNRVGGRLRVGHALALTAAAFHAVSLVRAATAAKADVQAALRRQDRDARRALAGSVRLRLHPPAAPQAAGADPPTTEAAPVSLPPQPAPGPATVRDIGGAASAAHYQDFYTI